ncbi:MAG: FAD:protein FMN transferase [Candidatus Delongbacteria bacterium]|nr:FAD:protein FMN transferase [Candidatus Delongbacteria bacterium]
MPSIQKRQRRLWIWSTIVVALLILFFRALERRELKPATVLLEGQTMGTTWHIRLGDWPAVLDDSSLKEKLQREIDAVLVRISASLSAWDERSVLSAFNAARADSLVEMDEDFQRVLEAAVQWQRATGGAFDPTVAPLVTLWGFGVDGASVSPTDEELDAARALTGMDQLITEPMPGGVGLTKRQDGVMLDVNAIAPGYAVDVLARLLRERGARNFTVEIGGELIVEGTRPEGGPWHIGVEAPIEGMPPGDGRWITVLGLDHGAVATSGSYRNYVRRQEGQLPHILDPRTGRPIQTSLVSVTVIAPDCTAADALATACMVLGYQDGMAMVERMAGVEALFVLQDPSGGFQQISSPGIAALELVAQTD